QCPRRPSDDPREGERFTTEVTEKDKASTQRSRRIRDGAASLSRVVTVTPREGGGPGLPAGRLPLLGSRFRGKDGLCSGSSVPRWSICAGDRGERRNRSATCSPGGKAPGP